MSVLDNNTRQLFSVLLSANKNGGSMWRSLKEWSNITHLIKKYLERRCIEFGWDEIDRIWAAEEPVNDKGVFIRFNENEWTSGPVLIETVKKVLNQWPPWTPSICLTVKRARHGCGGRICTFNCVGHAHQYDDVDTRVFKQRCSIGNCVNCGGR